VEGRELAVGGRPTPGQRRPAAVHSRGIRAAFAAPGGRARGRV